MENNIEKLLNKRLKDIEKLPLKEKRDYYEKLRDYCISLGGKKSSISFGQRFINKYNPKIRKFDIEVRGDNNLTNDGSVIVVNHSNSHDIINMYEVLTGLGKSSSILLTSEGLNPLVLALFKNAKATVINRFDKDKSAMGVYELANRVLNNNIGVVFGEGTWNLHPIKPMHNIKIGAAKVAAITKSPIIPVIMEYVEKNELCEKESELYKKCIIEFGEPVIITEEDSLIEQNERIQRIMEKMRKNIWYENSIKRDTIDDINPIRYINHTWLKEYDGLADGFDAEIEDKVLYSKDGLPVENEYYLDKYGNFVPGTIPKKALIRK